MPGETTSSPSRYEFTDGKSLKGFGDCLGKKGHKSQLDAMFLHKLSWYFFRMAMMALMSASLKVVSMAVSFLTATSLSLIFLRS